MKKLTAESRGTMYFRIQNQPLSVSERELIQVFDRARLDPRLMEILTEFVRDFWWVLDPRKLNHVAKKSRFPFMIKAALVCILDFCEIGAEDRLVFARWVKCVVTGIKDPRPQLLYVGVWPIGSKSMAREVSAALPCLREHGLIAKDLPFNKGQPGRLKNRSCRTHKLDDLDLLKLSLVEELKSIKAERRLRNDQVQALSGINRVFMSRILNNKFENITIEYLHRALARLKRSA